MAGPMGSFNYVSDNGTTYRMRLDASNAAAVGGDAATASAAFPRGWVPRYVLAQHPTNGRQRRIICPDPTHTLWLTAGGTVSLIDYATNLADDFNVRGRVGERRYDRAT